MARRAQFSGHLTSDRNGGGPSQREAPPHRSSRKTETLSLVPTPLPPPVSASGAQQDVDEDEVCFICAEPFKYYSLGSCNHVSPDAPARVSPRSSQGELRPLSLG